MFSIKFHTILCYIFIILMYNPNITFGQYADIEIHNNNKKVTSELIEKIVNKVCNITTKALAKSDHKDKERLIHKIEEKLYKSATNVRHGEAYVRMLMKGVRSVAYKESRKNVANNTSTLEDKSKLDMVNSVSEKIEIIAKALAKSNTGGNQKKAIQQIKKIIEQNASKKNKNHGNVRYSHIIAKGLEQTLQKVSTTEAPDSELWKPELPPTDIAGQTDIADNKLVKKSEEDSKDIPIVNKPELERRAIKPNRLKPNTLISDIKDVDCTEIRIHLCNNINALNVLQCPSDNTQLEISKLCDGTIDCTDNSDERDCTSKVSSIVHNATKLVMQIESSITLHCYPNSVEDEIVSQQNEVLRKVLEIQLKFIEKHSNDSYNVDTNYPGNTFMLRSTINELVTVIDTLSIGLKTSLCVTPKNFRKFNTDEIMNNEIDVMEKEDEVYKVPEDLPAIKPSHSLDKCVCVADNCKSQGSSCSPDCMMFCKQKYTLGRWQCNAVDHSRSVSIDVICDGKLDCTDHSDEEGCVDGFGFAKFEAHNLFEGIKDMILTKVKSEPNESLRNKMIRFGHFLKDLHAKITLKEPDTVDIKRIREYAFTALVDILDESGKTKTITEISSIFKLLMSWNVQLVKALMKTHTGNEKIITPDGCICAGNKCAQAECSKVCIRACSSETVLTRYYCEGSNRYEDSVPIAAICNGTAECNGKDDEFNCNKESCRLHHLVVLRRKIAKVGGNYRGTALGETLRAWKIKVNSSIKIAESEGSRPTVKIIREMIRVMLRDLVMAYASLEDSRRSNTDHVLDEFIKLSRILFETLRACGY